MLRRCLAFITPLLSVSVVAFPIRAESIVFCPTGTQADVQAAVDLVDSPGVVVLPPGTWDHLGSVVVAKDGVTIIGAGSKHTILRRDPPPQAADTKERAPYLAPFFRSKETSSMRVSSLAITSWLATGGVDDREVGISLTDASDYRVDQCDFRFTGNSGVMVQGKSKGVVDHNTFRDIYETVIANYGYGVSVYGSKEHVGEPFGTEHATFIEDNLLNGCRHAVASNRAARYVFRHNIVRTNTVSHAVDAHGAEYPPSPKPKCEPCYEPDPDNPGTEWAVVHDNLIEAPGYPSVAIGLRGGKGLIYNNDIRDYTTAIRLTKQTPQPTGPIHIWNNTIPSTTTLVTGAGECCGSSAIWELEAPSNYTPYSYPHPLVVNLVADAGPDQRVMLSEFASTAGVFVDGSGSSSAKESIKSVHWHLSPDPASSCVRDILDIPAGKYALLLAVESTSGQIQYDTSLVEVLPNAPLLSSPQWSDLWFPPFPKEGVISFKITPESSNTDAYVGLTGRREIKQHADHAMQVRANNQGFFDVRQDDTYSADVEIPYEAGKTYQVEISFDVAQQRYDVSVDGVVLAKDYAFRSKESLIGQLAAWHVQGLQGLQVTDITMSGEQLQPDPPCGGSTDAGVDGSAPEQDAGVDASPTVDAPSADSSSDDASKGGSGGSGEASTDSSDDSSGCSCRVGNSSNSSILWFGIALFAWLQRRRKNARPFAA